ncbi:MAG: hypothetical protein O3B86_16815, partial [Planctomycetota bacterium]|nr:hypothetical protein [Planctomycetota bacterium]
MKTLTPLSISFPVLSLVVLFSGSALAIEPCRINIVDEGSGWPVPLVELKTTHNVRFVSDNAGIIAFDLPELMGTKTWFTVEGHGYSLPKDGFGYRGVRLVPRAGETLTVKVQRQLHAKRLGRITGGGLFGESQKLALHTDWHEQGILGCDSVQNAVHNGRLFWGWGDTVLPGYPLGRFHMIGATTELQPLKSFMPPVRLRYDYLTDDSRTPRNVAEMPGKGPTWLSGYVSLPDKDGRTRLVASYAKIKPPLDVYEYGLCVWNEDQAVFEKIRSVWSKSEQTPRPPKMPEGHPVFWQDAAQQRWLLFGDPFPALKCSAIFEDWANPTTWQQLTPQSKVPVRDGEDQVQPHRGAIAWNTYLNKWVTVFTQH